MLDRVIVEGVVKRQRHTTWIAEDAIDTFLLQTVQKDFRA